MRLLLGIIAVFLTSVAALALEMDPYAAWVVDLEDSTTPINNFVNKQAAEVIEAASTSESCEKLSVKITKNIHTDLVTSKKLLRFIHNKKNGVDHKRGLSDGFFTSVFNSIYRAVPQVYLTSISSVLKFNSIIVGDDKFAHFFAFGRRYYERYLKMLEKNLSEARAEEEVIQYGIRIENGFFGKLLDGVFSHADLESNYQGYRLSRAMCEGASSYLKKIEGKWQLTRAIDLRDYINPGMDEFYNNSHFAPAYARSIRARIQNYCWMLADKIVRERLDYYRSVDVPSTSRRLVAEYFSSLGESPQSRDSLSSICKPLLLSKPKVSLPETMSL